MACKFICDGCGKEEKAIQDYDGRWNKPRDWYKRQDEDGCQDACSRDCIDIIAKNTGKTNVVIPL